MKLNKEDREQLRVWGYLESDMRQLQEAANKTKYEIVDKCGSRKIGVKTAIELLGRDRWLSGIGRSAFHWTAARPMDYNDGVVYFDSSAIFEGA